MAAKSSDDTKENDVTTSDNTKEDVAISNKKEERSSADIQPLNFPLQYLFINIIVYMYAALASAIFCLLHQIKFK